MSFLIRASAIEKAKDIAKRIDLVEGIPVGELNFSMEELLYNGVYVLKENNKVAYVGKASSRIFLERFAGHFDTRNNGGFNNLLKGIAMSQNKYERLPNRKLKFDEEDLKMIWRDTLNFKMICVTFDSFDNELLISKEKELIQHYNGFCKLYNRTIWNLELDYGYKKGEEIDVERNGVIRRFKIESASKRHNYIYGRFYSTKNVLSNAINPQRIFIGKII